MPGLKWYFAPSLSRYGAFKDTIVRKPLYAKLSLPGLFLSDFATGTVRKISEADPIYVEVGDDSIVVEQGVVEFVHERDLVSPPSC